MVFLDGLGLGPKCSHSNPLASFSPQILRVFQEETGPFLREGLCLPTNASLGVEGLPQSATGQTAIYTGINAPARLGRHLPGFPDQRLRDIIAAHSLFQKLKQAGKKVAFANTYTPAFFEQPPRWVSVTTFMCLSSGTRLRNLEDLQADRSLYMDFTNQLLKERGISVPSRSPREAALVLADLSHRYQLCLYEYFLTDLVGHRGTYTEAASLLAKLDDFLTELVRSIDLDKTSLIITSDHGNIEDMTTRLHTGNPVPSLIWGPLKDALPPGIDFNLTQIAPLIETFLNSSREVACETGR